MINSERAHDLASLVEVACDLQRHECYNEATQIMWLHARLDRYRKPQLSFTEMIHAVPSFAREAIEILDRLWPYQLISLELHKWFDNHPEVTFYVTRTR